MTPSNGTDMLDLFDKGGGGGGGGSGGGGGGGGSSGGSGGAVKSSTKKRGLEGILSGIGELWEKEEYETEFDVNDFVRSLDK